MIRISTLLIVISTLTFQSSQGSPAPSPSSTPRKPAIRLTCAPRISFASPRQPATVWATLHIVRPDEALWCPSISWYADGNFQSGIQSDCPPYTVARAATKGEELEWWSEESSRQFLFRSGNHTISVRLSKMGKVVGSSECSVYVR